MQVAPRKLPEQIAGQDWGNGKTLNLFYEIDTGRYTDVHLQLSHGNKLISKSDIITLFEVQLRMSWNYGISRPRHVPVSLKHYVMCCHKNSHF